MAAKKDATPPPIPIPPAYGPASTAVPPVEAPPKVAKRVAAPAAPPVAMQPQPVAAPPYPLLAYGPPTSGAPTYQPAQPYGYAPGYVAPARGLSIASMVCGLSALFLSLFWIGFLPGLAAVITGHIATKRQPYARGFWLTGIITGYVSIGIAILALVVVIVIFATYAQLGPIT